MSCILTNCEKESSELCLVDDLARSQPLVSPWVLIPVFLQGGEDKAFAY